MTSYIFTEALSPSSGALPVTVAISISAPETTAFGLSWYDGEQSDGWVVFVLPPSLVHLGPEFGDLRLARYQSIRVVTVVSPCERDCWECLNVSILLAGNIRKEVDRVFSATWPGGHRAATLFLPGPGRQHANIDLARKLSHTVNHFFRRCRIIVLAFFHRGLDWAT